MINVPFWVSAKPSDETLKAGWIEQTFAMDDRPIPAEKTRHAHPILPCLVYLSGSGKPLEKRKKSSTSYLDRAMLYLDLRSDLPAFARHFVSVLSLRKGECTPTEKAFRPWVVVRETRRTHGSRLKHKWGWVSHIPASLGEKQMQSVIDDSKLW